MKLWLSGWLLVAGLSTVVIGQGTVNFANVVGPPTGRVIDAPVTGLGSTRLTGPDWVAQLYAGPSASSLEPVGPYVPFLTGAGAGYFLGGTRVIPTVASGDAATVEVRVWALSTGSTWETAYWKLSSSSITVTTGGSGSPPTVPSNLNGLQRFGMIPEPSTLLLAGTGLLIVLFRRLRR